MKTLASLAAVALLTGCAAVPATSLSVNPQTGVVTLNSPKDVHADLIDVTLPNGTHWVLKGYSSTNNPADLAIVAAANAQMAGQAMALAQAALAAFPKSGVPVGMSQTVTNTVPVTVTNTFRITPE